MSPPERRRKRITHRVKKAGILPATVMVLLTLFLAAALLWIGFTRLLRDAWPWQEGGLETTTPTPAFQTTQLVLTLVAGIGGAILVVVAYRRQRDLELARFDERFAAAAAQLGAPTAAERLAGVYAMAALADTWEKHRQQCIDVLCGYLRLPYDPSNALLKTVVSEHTWPIGAATGKETRTYEQLPNDREVRLTVISTITRHLRDGAPVSWQGHDLDFTGATFDDCDFSKVIIPAGSVNFDQATFSGGVNFSEATFAGGEVSFDDVRFSAGSGAAFLAATFSGSRISFRYVMFSQGSSILFTNANFSGGNISFDGSTFSGGYADFSGAQSAGSEVTFHEATYSGGRVFFKLATFSGGNVSFDESTFSGSHVAFNEATFSGGHVTFYEATFSGGHVTFNRSTFSSGEVTFAFTVVRRPLGLATFVEGVVTRDGAEFRGWPPPDPDPEPTDPAAG